MKVQRFVATFVVGGFAESTMEFHAEDGLEAASKLSMMLIKKEITHTITIDKATHEIDINVFDNHNDLTGNISIALLNDGTDFINLVTSHCNN